MRSSTLLFAPSVLLSVFISRPAQTQITPDQSLPQPSVITNEGNTNVITEGTQAENNLFHSFEQFSIPINGTAYFNNALDIQNIISRVTGNSVSNIDGLIRANGTANLFLLNPNGIIFGPNASLDIGGSFVASTASNINFADGTQFPSRADSDSVPLLTVSVPIGLGFGSSPKAITVKGNGRETRMTLDPIDTDNGLRVPSDKTLALVGGNVILEGATLKTAGGRIELGSVADSTNQVSLNSISDRLTLDYSQVQNFQDIQLVNQAIVDVSGNNAGDVQVRGKNISIEGGSQIESSNLDILPGGTINVVASDSINLSGTSPEGFPSGLFAVNYFGEERGSNLAIETNRFNLKNGAQIVSLTFSSGAAGNLSIKALESIEIIGNATNTSLGTGIDAGTEGSGAGGNLLIETGQLSIQNGARIVTSTFGSGTAGNLSIKARDSIEIIGTLADGSSPSGFSTSAEVGSSGDGGSLSINTEKLSLQDGGRAISSTSGTGKAGNLNVEASSIEISGASTQQIPSGLSAQTLETGQAGNLIVKTDQLTVKNEGEITVSSRGLGNAGNLDIFADSIRLDNQAKLRAETTSSEGGNINLQVKDGLSLRRNSQIFTTAGNFGNGGNISINSSTLVALENSNIVANASGGAGGNIQISTQGLFLSPDSIISASSERGIDGAINIQRLGFDVRQNIVPLEKNFINPEQIVAGSCLARRNVNQSNFVVTGSGGLPLNPNSEIEGWENLSTSNQPAINNVQLERSPSKSPEGNITYTSSKKWKVGDPIVEAQGIIRLPNGRVILGMASQEPASAQSLICRS